VVSRGNAISHHFIRAIPEKAASKAANCSPEQEFPQISTLPHSPSVDRSNVVPRQLIYQNTGEPKMVIANWYNSEFISTSIFHEIHFANIKLFTGTALDQ
jgi:hypothetical protein